MPYSDKEKTFLDVLYFKLKFTLKELQEMAKGLDKKKLEAYLKKYPQRTWINCPARILTDSR